MMPRIKTRETRRDIKLLNKASMVGARMKNALLRSKDAAANTANQRQTSAEEYAGVRFRYAGEDVAQKVGHAVRRTGQVLVKKGKEVFRPVRRKSSDCNNQNDPGLTRTETTGQSMYHSVQGRSGQATDGALPHPLIASHTDGPSEPSFQSPSRYVTPLQSTHGPQRELTDSPQAYSPSRSVETAEHAELSGHQNIRFAKQTVVKSVQKSIKHPIKAAKTADPSMKAVIKTAQTAAAAHNSAQATTLAAQKAVRAARSSSQAAKESGKTAAKSASAAVKSTVNGMRELIAAFAAGGSVAAMTVVIICLIGLIVGSSFGIFFSRETGSLGGRTLNEAIREIDGKYNGRIETLKSSVSYDDLVLTGSRSIWKEVLAVYAVKTVTDPDNPLEVASMSSEKEQLLRSCFWDMNEIESWTETYTEMEIVEQVNDDGETVEVEVEVDRLRLYIIASHKTADQMAAEYGFTTDQVEQLHELLADENSSLWNMLLYGISKSDDAIVAVALSQVGNIGGEPYWSWYGYQYRVPWCAIFVSWCANECGHLDSGVIPRFEGCIWGVQWFRDRDQWIDAGAEPTPGMLIFFDWSDPTGEAGYQDGLPDHVGIVEKVEDGYVYTVEGNSGDCCRNNRYPLGYSQILGYGMPCW